MPGGATSRRWYPLSLDTVATKLSKQLPKLSKRGPHRVLVGDLAYAGIEGRVYTPAEGNGIPGVVFAHDWKKGVEKYHGTLRHLASWGIAVAAPNTERGWIPDVRGFAADIETCLQILTGVKLGTGNVSVAPGRIGVAGHGMGAAAAVLAAAQRDNVAAVAALYPATSHPNAEELAAKVQAPGLVITTDEEAFFDYGNAAKMAANWGGDVVYREMEKGRSQVLSEDVLFKLATGTGGIKTGVREQVRGLTTGFFLHELAGENKYQAFSDPEQELKKTRIYTGEDLKERADLGTFKR